MITINTSEKKLIFRFAPKLAETQSCQLPCPVDCILSEFSFWQKCSVTCGNGTETRVNR